MQVYEAATSIAHAYAKQVGLNIDWTSPFPTISELACLTQTPKEFDFESSHWPSQFHYTGPFHDGFGRIESDFPWDLLTGEPLIFASIGKLQNGLESVFKTISEAVGTRREMQLVFSIDPAVDPKHIDSLPPNCIVVNHTPQVELLRRSALCITHAGLNTVLESLTQGVPMVAIPITNDQPGVAGRIAHASLRVRRSDPPRANSAGSQRISLNSPGPKVSLASLRLPKAPRQRYELSASVEGEAAGLSPLLF
jgi:zeaxanthin glucosyltransferase